MRVIMTIAALVLAQTALWSAPAHAATAAEMAAAARGIQQACVARGEDAIVCACGVGLAAAELDERVFTLAPQIEPLLDQKNQAAALMSLYGLAAGAGLSVSDGMEAYETIRANRTRVAQVCKPLTE